MNGAMRQRGLMALIGGLAGASLYLLTQVLERDILSDREALALSAFAVAFFIALLALAGPLALRRAAAGAAVLALGVAGLLVWASLRFATVEGFMAAPLWALAGAVLALVPLPFIIAATGPGWRDYPTLFTQAWTIVVRYAAAWLFVGAVWAVIWLSDALLGLVGLRIIEDLIRIPLVPWLITGATLGLALAVVTELADLVSPYLILRLLRLLLPVVAVVMTVFILALPFSGMTGLFGSLSAAATLLVMTAAAATLVTTAIDQSDTEASDSLVLTRATQGLALILPVPAVLGCYAIWLRVAQYGWTPNRVITAVLAVLGLGYGLLYAVAVLRGAGWMARIRQGNTTMALALMAVAALLLTPILNPERIAANSQLARFIRGQTGVEALEPATYESWGRAGAAALTRLQELSLAPGQEALALRLAQSRSSEPLLPVAADQVVAALREAMPLRPASAQATRDRLMTAIAPDEQRDWLTACLAPMADGRPGCVMVVGDFWPGQGGDEAIALLHQPDGYNRFEGLVTVDGQVQRRSVIALPGFPVDAAQAEALLATLQRDQPEIVPAPINQVTAGAIGLIILP
ncbi:MAG: DUF4153 domain-containing protein [Pseudorhodobacter sp.]|nr:DUF4153 domain-containing protein [Pseudorhodobacter sp.]